MSDQQSRDASGVDGEGSVGNDAVDGTQIGFKDASQESDGQDSVEIRDRRQAHDPAHVNLQQAEYTPEEVARLMGTSLEVVMHAIRSGELKAEREGQAVVCIEHSDVVEWLRRRGPGV